MGALITTSVLSGLILIGVEPNWQQIVVAALIAIAVGVQGIGGMGRDGPVTAGESAAEGPPSALRGSKA